jgi:tRNA threonylcarbamoyladenosine biosynthesis protein TsaB
MKILGIDTSTKFLCLGAYDGSKVYEYNLEVGRQLSSLLAVTIQRVLDTLSWQFKDIDFFACGLGPGSFTGMRTGISTIKGFCFALKKPVIGISTLDMLAQGVKPTQKPIVSIVDAKRNLIYCGVFKKTNGSLRRIKPYMLLSIKEFLKIIKPGSIILGDALNLYKADIVKNVKGADILDKDYWYPKAHSLIELALARTDEKKIDSPFDIKPIYLYPKECQIRK